MQNKLSKSPLAPPGSLQSPLDCFYAWEKKYPDKIYLRQPQGNTWRELSYAEVGRQARALAQYLLQFQLPSASNIAIFSRNSAYWIIADLAIWMSGHVTVPIYPTANAETFDYILQHAQIKVLFLGPVDGEKQSEFFQKLEIPLLALPGRNLEGAQKYDEVIAHTKPLTASPQRLLTDLATIVYTSGTTSKPKGVMHSFGNMARATQGIMAEVNIRSTDRFFSYLMLAHIAERFLIEVLSLYFGLVVSFCESQATFAKNIQDAQPTVFLAVPRIWQKIQSMILTKIPQKKLSLFCRIPLVANFIRWRIRKTLGLQKVHLAITGSAPTPKELIDWYRRYLGIYLQEAYGMTENFTYSHFTKTRDLHLGWVGQPFPGVAVKIAEDGELLIRSPANMLGYYKDPEATQAILVEGYLHTGDQGEVDADGFLRITGRARDSFKTSKGKFVVPGPIEQKISGTGYFENVCVIGNGLSQPLALVNIGPSLSKEDRESQRRDLDQVLDSINRSLEQHERLQKIVVIQTPWTVENNFLTATLKVKREQVEKNYQSHLAEWESSKGKVLFF